MKVNPLTTAFRSIADRVTAKADTDSARDERRGQQHGQKDQDSKKGRDEVPVTDADVGKAVEHFAADTQTQATGLSAQVEGHGPGLRVVLKDRTGQVIRQLTGEEFVKMREDGKTHQIEKVGANLRGMMPWMKK